MKLEIQQVNLELSKQLREAGYPQEGLWWWNKFEDMWELKLKSSDITCSKGRQFEGKIVAPTVAELGERLPRYIELKVIAGQTQTHYLYTTKSFNNEWGVFYAMNNGRTRHHREYADTEADCRAKMWLYLKKRNKK